MVNVENRRGVLKMNPNIIKDYNAGMPGIGDLSVIPELRPQAKFHYLEPLPATKKKAPAKPYQWKRCRKEKRRETRCVCFLSD